MRLLLKNVILNSKKVDILIEKNKISKIKSFIDVKCQEKIDAKGEKAVLPGLINCHTHSAMILFRGLAENLPLKEWLKTQIWPREKKLTEDDVFWGTKFACLEMIKSGTTFFNEMYWFEEAQIEAVLEMRMRAVLGLVLLDFLPFGQKEHVEKVFFKWKKFLKKQNLISFSVAPHAIYTVSKENLIFAKNFAKKNNLILHMHLCETKDEVNFCLKKYKLRPVEFLEKIGFLGKNCVLAHCVWLNEKEIEILKKRKCSLVFNPCSNAKLISGVFPLEKVKGKLNVCLGTDGPCSNNSLDLFSEMKFAILIEKITKKDHQILFPKEAFEMATKNGAKALKQNTGEIKEGKLADLILIDLKKIQTFPHFDLISNLIFAGGGSCVSDVICDGKILMRDQKIEGEEKIIKKFKEIELKILSLDTKKEKN